jgi:hypothetical protein
VTSCVSCGMQEVNTRHKVVLWPSKYKYIYNLLRLLARTVYLTGGEKSEVSVHKNITSGHWHT